MGTHRVEQVLQAAASLVEAQPDLAAAVFQHRTLSLSGEDQELSAVCINQGPDLPPADTGYTNLAFIDSLSMIDMTLYAQGATQAEIAAELLRLRSATHKAMLQSPRDLGLPFVIGIRYAGAGAPEYTELGAPMAGRMTCSFGVLYRMDLDDPE